MKKLFAAVALAALTVHVNARSIQDALPNSRTCSEQVYVDLSHQGINDWRGISELKSWFPNMRHLNLSNNSFTSIPSAIHSLRSLEGLDLSYNHIREVTYDLSSFVGNSAITHLNLSGNPLEPTRRHTLVTDDFLQGIVIIN